MNRAEIIGLLQEAEARVCSVQDRLRDASKNGLAEKAYSIEGKLMRLIDDVRDIDD